MSSPEKFRITLYNMDRGVEFTYSVRGSANLANAMAFLNGLLAIPSDGGDANPEPGTSPFFVVDDQQLTAFSAFMKEHEGDATK